MCFDSAARWIWLTSDLGPINQYVQFHRSFTLTQRPRRALLLLAVDTQYALFVNGQAISGRAFSDYPQHRSVDRHDITPHLKTGRNSIALLGYFFGQDNSEYRKGRPGLIVQVDVDGHRWVSNREWKVRPSPGFTSGKTEEVTHQMGFTVQFDARREDLWTATPYRPGKDWTPATELAGPTDGYWTHLAPRKQQQLDHGAWVSGRPIALGEIIRPPSARTATPSLAFAADFKHAACPIEAAPYPVRILPPRSPANGQLVLVDLGQETFGLLHLELEAPAGTLLDISHGEHLDDLGVRATPGYRRFGDRFICRQGLNRFTLPFRRLGCRYIEIHLFDFTQPVTLHALGLISVSYPVNESGSYESPDHLMAEIRIAASRTLRLCMADHYMDCPWREQSLYAYDSRNQAHYGYYAFGEYTYPLQSFRLLGWGKRPDGFLELCAPARIPTNIPIFSLVWISALRDHYLFSGQPTLFREFRETAEGLLQKILGQQDTKTGLCNIFDGYWAFYEWVDGLDYKREPTFTPDGKFRLDAPHNLYAVEALRAYADMLDFAGEAGPACAYRQEATRLGKAIHRVFWDPQRQRYASYADRLSRWHYAAGVQGLALSQNICPPPSRAPLQNSFLSDSSLTPITLSALFYAWQAMTNAPAQGQQAVLDQCIQSFGSMVLGGSTTLWEVIDGGPAFNQAGSLCHGWSAAPIWLQQAYILGIRPLTPGFRTFSVQPHPCGLPGARGVIPTPSGPIDIAWKTEGNRFFLDLHAPSNLKPILHRPPGWPGPLEMRINGKPSQPTRKP